MAPVAKQRAVTLGDTIGNDYAVTDGLKPGEKVIISGISVPHRRFADTSNQLAKILDANSAVEHSRGQKQEGTGVWLIFSLSGLFLPRSAHC